MVANAEPVKHKLYTIEPKSRFEVALMFVQNHNSQKQTFPRSICRYSVFLLLAAHQYLELLRRPYLGKLAGLDEDAVIWLSGIFRDSRPNGTMQSIIIVITIIIAVKAAVAIAMAFAIAFASQLHWNHITITSQSHHNHIISYHIISYHIISYHIRSGQVSLGQVRSYQIKITIITITIITTT